MLTIYYINLERRTDRKLRLENELTRMGYPFVRISAVDGSVSTPEDFPVKEILSDKHNFTLCEKACAQSHINALKEAEITCTTDWVLILEDDATFPTWLLENPKFLEQTLTHAPLGYNAYMLGYAATTLNQKGELISGSIYQKQPSFWGTHAIAYRKHNIYSVLDKLPIDRPFDFWMGNRLDLCFVASPFTEWSTIRTSENAILEYGGLVMVEPSISDIKNDWKTKVEKAIEFQKVYDWKACADILRTAYPGNDEEEAAMCDVGIAACFRVSKEEGEKYIKRMENLSNTNYYKANSERILANVQYYKV